jgi:hypothetical protein
MSTLEEECEKCIVSCKKCYAYSKKQNLDKLKDYCLQCMYICKLVCDLAKLDNCTLEKMSDKLCLTACKCCIKECTKHKNIVVCTEFSQSCKNLIKIIMDEYTSGGGHDNTNDNQE